MKTRAVVEKAADGTSLLRVKGYLDPDHMEYVIHLSECLSTGLSTDQSREVCMLINSCLCSYIDEFELALRLDKRHRDIDAADKWEHIPIPALREKE